MCNGVESDSTPPRLLSRTEYNNTVAELTGDTSAPLTISPSASGSGFENDAASLSISPRLVEQYMELAAGIATRALSRRSELLPCDPAGGAACARDFVRGFGARAYRRPLRSDEEESLVALFTSESATSGFDAGLELVIETLLQSPAFLYHIEEGTPVSGEAGLYALTDFEIASRLSYFLWSSMPDSALLDAAGAGALHTPEQISAQAERLLDDPRAHAAARKFHTEWLELDRLDTASRDPARYPEFDATLRDAMKRETLDFLDGILFGGGDVSSLFAARATTANDALATLYGMPAGTAPAGDFGPVTLDDAQRAGLLTQASFLTIHAKYDRSSPIHRGVFVRRKILCQPLPPPPPDVPPPPMVGDETNERERLAIHREDPVCNTCHAMIDPIGLAFEHYDAIGRWRATDVDGSPVDATGSLDHVGDDVDGPVDGAVDMSERLAESAQVRRCVATQWFRRAFARTEDTDDACTLQDIQDRFGASGFVLRDLLIAITQTDAFRHRRASAPTGGCP